MRTLSCPWLLRLRSHTHKKNQNKKVCTREHRAPYRWPWSPSASPGPSCGRRLPDQPARAPAWSAEPRGLPEARRELPRRLQTRILGRGDVVFRADFSEKVRGTWLAAPRESGRQCAPVIRVPRAEAAPVPERGRGEDPEVRARRGSHAANRPPRERRSTEAGHSRRQEGGARCHRAPSPGCGSPGCARGEAPTPESTKLFP